jgi:hypothetical protein
MKSRKLWLTIGIVVVSFVYCGLKFIGEQTLATIVIGIITLYFTGNVVDRKLNGVDNDNKPHQ